MASDNLFAAFSDAEVKAYLDAAKAELYRRITGQQVVGTGVGGKSFSFSTMATSDLEGLIRKLTSELQSRDSANFGKRVTRTVAKFNHLDDGDR